MKIEYYRKNVYGVEQTYILNPETAKLVSSLTGKKTVNEKDLEVLAKLGLGVSHNPIN